MVEVRYLPVGSHQIAYRLREGRGPTLVFFSGYASDMEGTKALALDAFAERRGLSVLRFDYSGTGSSSGRFEDGTLTGWLEQSVAAIDELTGGPLVIVGSSMGGWIALHVALQRAERVQAIVGIAAAPDFTDWGFGEQHRAMLRANGRLGEPDGNGKATPNLMTLQFWQSGQALRLLIGEIGFDGPVRLIHGDQDRDVPSDIAFRTMAALRSADVQLKLIKDGGHRLSEPHEIRAILETVDALIQESAP